MADTPDRTAELEGGLDALEKRSFTPAADTTAQQIGVATPTELKQEAPQAPPVTPPAPEKLREAISSVDITSPESGAAQTGLKGAQAPTLPWSKIAESDAYKNAPQAKRAEALTNYAQELGDYLDSMPNADLKKNRENVNKFFSENHDKIEQETNKGGFIGGWFANTATGGANLIEAGAHVLQHLAGTTKGEQLDDLDRQIEHAQNMADGKTLSTVFNPGALVKLLQAQREKVAADNSQGTSNAAILNRRATIQKVIDYEEKVKSMIPGKAEINPEAQPTFGQSLGTAVSNVQDMAMGGKVMIAKLATQTWEGAYEQALKDNGGDEHAATVTANGATMKSAPLLLAYAGGGKLAGLTTKLLPKSASLLTRGLVGGGAAAATNLLVSGASRRMEGGKFIGDTSQNLTDALFGAVGGATELLDHASKTSKQLGRDMAKSKQTPEDLTKIQQDFQKNAEATPAAPDDRLASLKARLDNNEITQGQYDAEVRALQPQAAPAAAPAPATQPAKEETGPITIKQGLEHNAEGKLEPTFRVVGKGTPEQIEAEIQKLPENKQAAAREQLLPKAEEPAEAKPAEEAPTEAPQPAETTEAKPSDFKPAIRLPSEDGAGEVIPGNKGETHKQIKTREADAAIDNPEKAMGVLEAEHGFVGPDGKFLTRDELRDKIAPGEKPMHSERLKELQDQEGKVPAEAVKPTAEAAKPAEEAVKPAESTAEVAKEPPAPKDGMFYTVSELSEMTQGQRDALKAADKIPTEKYEAANKAAEEATGGTGEAKQRRTSPQMRETEQQIADLGQQYEAAIKAKDIGKAKTIEAQLLKAQTERDRLTNRSREETNVDPHTMDAIMQHGYDPEDIEFGAEPEDGDILTRGGEKASPMVVLQNLDTLAGLGVTPDELSGKSTKAGALKRGAYRTMLDGLLDSNDLTRGQKAIVRLLQGVERPGHDPVIRLGHSSNNAAGWYGARPDGAPDLFLNLASNHSGGIATTFLHEAVHHGMREIIEPDYPRTAFQQKAYDDLQTLYQHTLTENFKRTFNREPTDAERQDYAKAQSADTLKDVASAEVRDTHNRALYGLTNFEEFITESLTNPKFQALLKEISPAKLNLSLSERFKNVWDAVKSSMANMFVGRPVAPDSALFQALNIGERLLRESPEERTAPTTVKAAEPEGEGPAIRINLSQHGTPDLEVQPWATPADVTKMMDSIKDSPHLETEDKDRLTAELQKQLARSDDLQTLAEKADKAGTPAEKQRAGEALEAQLTDTRTFGPRNESVDRQREERGLTPSMARMQRAQPKVWAEAMSEIEKNPLAGSDLVTDINKARGGKKVLTDTEVAILSHETVTRRNTYDRLVDEENAAKTPAELADVRSRKAAARLRLEEAYTALDLTGTATAQAFAMRQIAIDPDELSLGHMLDQVRGANREINPTEKQKAQVEKRVKEAEDTYQKLKVQKDKVDTVNDLATAKKEQADVAKAEKGDREAEARVKEAATKEAAATGKTLSPEKALERYKKGLQTRLDALKAKIEAGDYNRATRNKIDKSLDEAARDLQAEYKRTRQDWEMGVIRDEMAKRPVAQKAADMLQSYIQAGAISRPTAIGKLYSAILWRYASQRLEQLTVPLFRALPGTSQIFKAAPTEGTATFAAEGAALKGLVGPKAWKDMWDELTKGGSDLKVLYGRPKLRPRLFPLEMVGRLHAAIKAPVLRSVFEMSQSLQQTHYENGGINTNDPNMQSMMAVQSFKQGERAIFQQNNRAANAFKTGLGALGRADKTGNVPLWALAAKTGLVSEAPVVGVPANIVAEAAQNVFGLVSGVKEMAHAFKSGIETLQPEEADMIARNLKKGLVGNSLLALAWFAPAGVLTMGGFYKEGEKRRSKDVQPMEAKLYGHEVSKTFLHSPLAYALQIVGTMRRTLDPHTTPNKAQRSAINALGNALVGFGEEIPFTNLVRDAKTLMEPNGWPKVLSQTAKNILLPGIVQWEAQREDKTKSGKEVKRTPDSKKSVGTRLKQTIETGIPASATQLPIIGDQIGTRKNVPKSKSQP